MKHWIVVHTIEAFLFDSDPIDSFQKELMWVHNQSLNLSPQT